MRIASHAPSRSAGLRAWVVCLGCGLALFTVMGLGVNAFTVYQPYLLRVHGFTNAQGSWITTVRSLFALLSMLTVDRLCRRLVQLGLTRSDGIVALGGGVTGDLAGFAAATLLRGVALVQAPTTLLAQVDSAVGGKTGLDLPEGKNLLGCFYQPRMVLADTACLATLPRRQLACGMAEVIKYGCIADEELLTRLERQEPDWPRIIRRCLACKAALVAQDERDEGPRRLLNFGHTFGHAMEALGGGRYTHGECVAAGMMEMLRWQTAHGSDQTAMLARLGTLLERYDLPRRLDDLPETAWRQYLLRDKKRSGGEMTIAVLERPGHGVLWSVTPEELLEETRWM